MRSFVFDPRPKNLGAVLALGAAVAVLPSIQRPAIGAFVRPDGITQIKVEFLNDGRSFPESLETEVGKIPIGTAARFRVWALYNPGQYKDITEAFAPTSQNTSQGRVSARKLLGPGHVNGRVTYNHQEKVLEYVPKLTHSQRRVALLNFTLRATPMPDLHEEFVLKIDDWKE